MKQFHTHYDNLKVARNAPPEIIRAAYKTLSQKYHPDRNTGNSESARIMAIINSSYEVLSDPVRRREHDLWITEMENTITNNNNVNRATQSPGHQASNNTSVSVLYKLSLSLFNQIKALFIWSFNYVIAIGMIVGIIWLIGSVIDIFEEKDSLPPSSKPYQASPPSNQSKRYVRPNIAPNGQPWPSSAGYIKGYQQLHTDGLSTVTIDNIQNDSDVFVKLVSLDNAQAYPVRQFYIPAFGNFTLNKVTAGNYDIRYRDLSNGGLSRSEAFHLKEIPTSNSTQFSNITMTLYKVQNGNMQTYGLSEAEF